MIAHTDADALETARRAYAVFRKNFDYLWQLHDDPMAGQLLPPTWEELETRGEALAGSPATVASRLEALADPLVRPSSAWGNGYHGGRCSSGCFCALCTAFERQVPVMIQGAE